MSSRSARELLNVPDVSKIDIIGAQDEVIFVEFSMQAAGDLGIDRAALLAALRPRTTCNPAGIIETGDERISIRVTGAFQSEQDILDINFVAGGRMIRMSDIAQVRRGYRRSAAAHVPRQRQAGDRAGHRHARRRRRAGAREEHRSRAWREIKVDLPIGIEPHLVANQPATVEVAIGEFMESLWQAVAIILGDELPQPGRARRVSSWRWQSR